MQKGKGVEKNEEKSGALSKTQTTGILWDGRIGTYLRIWKMTSCHKHDVQQVVVDMAKEASLCEQAGEGRTLEETSMLRIMYETREGCTAVPTSR